jgi:putative spermidine/putrescine transport system substrate-binding protein
MGDRMLHINRRHALAGLAATAVSGRAVAQPSTFTTNMYGGRWENTWREKVLPPFSKTIGRSVTLDIGLGTRWVSNFRAAGKDNPPFSALMLNERYTAMLRDDGFFEPLTPALVPNLADVVPSAILKDNTAVTGMLAPLVIAYRTDLVKKPPRGWADLWRPDLRGQLGLYAITNSAAVMLALWAAEHFGKGPTDIDTAVKKFAELKPFPQIAYSAQLTPLLTQGQIAVAPIDIGEIVPLKQRGLPLDFVVPEEGMMVFDQSFSVLARGADKAAAAKYLDYVLSPEIQLFMAKEWLIAPTNGKVKLPAELESLPLTPAAIAKAKRFDWTEVNKLTADLATAWSKAI